MKGPIADSERCYRENCLGAALLARLCATRNLPFVTFSSDLVIAGMILVALSGMISRGVRSVEKRPHFTSSKERLRIHVAACALVLPDLLDVNLPNDNALDHAIIQVA